MFNTIASQSPTFRTELDAAMKDHNIEVIVQDVGNQRMPDRAPADSVVTRHSDGTLKVIINVDPGQEQNAEHEMGHEKDARTNTNQFFADAAKDARDKGGPAEKPHDDRPVEQRANKFKDQVEKERKDSRKQEKEERKRKKAAPTGTAREVNSGNPYTASPSADDTHLRH